MHVEHWDNALRGPTVAAANALGGDEVWDPVPYFWSEQWGRMVQYAGHHPAGDRVVWREDGERWAAFWLAGDRLVAALTVDRPRDLVQARRLMERDAVVDAGLLADPTVAVKAAAARGRLAVVDERGERCPRRRPVAHDEGADDDGRDREPPAVPVPTSGAAARQPTNAADRGQHPARSGVR